jgi:signal transduction histidine kinase
VVAASTCRAIVQCLPHAVVLLNEQLRVVLANRAACSLFHVAAHHLRGASIAEFLPPKTLDLLLRDFSETHAKVIEATLPIHGRGEAATLSVTGVPLRYRGSLSRNRGIKVTEDRARDFRLLVIEDISDKVMLEHQVVESEKQAAIGQLAAGILHEVANPMTSLGSNLAFVRGAVERHESREVLQAVDLSLEQLDLMNQLLGSLSAVRRRPMPVYETADLHDVIRRCAAFVAKEAEQRRVRVLMSLEPLGPMLCEIDVRLVKRVLLNLFKNAMEAMPDGGSLQVRTSYRLSQPDQVPSIVIEVGDTGTGIQDSDLRKVFRPLFSTKPRGAGLGLSFCRQAVEEHGGEIRLTSGGKDHGTTVTVSLPVQQSAEVACL